MAINFDHTGAGDIALDSTGAANMRIDGNDIFHAGNHSATADVLRSNVSDNYTNGTLTFDSGTIVDIATGAVFNFNQTTGTAPFTVDSTTAVANLNADLLDGSEGAAYALLADNEAVTGTWTFNTALPTSSLTPSAGNELTTKTYVDSVIDGRHWKAPALASTTGNITLSGTQTVDGVGLVADDRCLVQDQTAADENGIYVVAAGAWARSSDADTWDELVSAAILVEEGTVNADLAFICISDAGGTLETTDVDWAPFPGGSTVYTAGDGLGESPALTFNVNVANGIALVTDNVELDIDSLSAITTLADADVFAVHDSAEKKITWANVKNDLLSETQTVSAEWTFSASPAITASNTRIGANAESDTKQVLSLASGQFSAAGDASVNTYVLRRATTNATQSVITTDGASESSSNTMIMPADTTWGFRVTVAARRADVDGESASYEFKGSIKRDGTAGSTAIVGTVFKSVYAESDADWDVAVDAETTNGSLRVQVTGEAAKTINWVGHAEIIQSIG